MRLPVLALLLLSAAGPAIAAAPDTDERAARPSEERAGRPGRSEPRFERAQRAEREEPRFERREPRERPEPRAERAAPRFEPPQQRIEQADRSERAEPQAERRSPAFGAIARGMERAQRAERGEQVPAPARSASEGRPADGLSRWREREAERRGRPAEVPPAPSPPVLAQPRSGLEGVRSADSARRPSGYSERRMHDVLRDRIAAESWRREWRRDRDYDWRRHRDWDRRRFHVGIYVDPFGWRYRDWDIGWRLPSRFYSARYWISDPWYYRLPPVYGPYRWIRYYDDVLLVDLRSGRVIDRIRNFFW
ncbi:RcnB family protein [Sphingomonas sp. LHG3406-1]|uniref:RcnB family protein n=1 Tax=Sphingomonas sp. LHG3406-1 TaxID=2804617 RepID=UPI0026158B45|nr:RcnB family protein [Sphingomonas sp. LHG3406-1]